MKPELSVRYNSRNATRPDTFTGLGWELSTPYIQRERAKGVEDIFSKAYFSSSISGNLITTTDTSSSQYTTYRPEVDNGEYLKYTYNSDGTWTVTGKDGRTYTYGGTSASRQDKPGDSTKVYKWMLSKIADSHGNEIQYSYTKDNGQIYPDQIIYTYHASSPAVNTVTFNYTTPASYGSTAYNAAFPVTTYKLLSSIVASTTVSSATTSHTYTFSYGSAQFINQKLLTGIERTHSIYGSQYSQPFNDLTEFTYSTKTAGWENSSYSMEGYLQDFDGSTIWRNIFTSDFDMNGYPDVLLSNKTTSQQYYNYLMMNSGSAFTESGSSWSLPTNKMVENFNIVDLNGDKLPDLHPRNYGTSDTRYVYLNTGSSFTSDDSRVWEVGTYIDGARNCGYNTGSSKNFDMNAFLYDINGDGKNDIIYFGGTSNFLVYLNNGNGYTASSAYTFTPDTGVTFTIYSLCSGDVNQANYQTLMDVNGDGLPDYYHQTYGTYLNTGSGFAYSAAYDIDIPSGYLAQSGFADINADGLIDYVTWKDSCTRVWFNNGAGFTPINPASTSNCTNSNVWDPVELKYANSNSAYWGNMLDVTADGYPDIIGAETYQTNGKVRAISNGRDAWVTGATGWTSIITPSQAIFFDINSDDVIDFITPNTGWSNASLTYMGKSAAPNRLVQIETPFNAQTAIEYGPTPSGYSDTHASPISVVKKLTVGNIGQSQPSMVTQYGYTKGVYNTDTATGQKRFAGFHKVTATESGSDLSPLRITETYFHQGNGSDSATNEPTDTSLALIGKPYYSITKNSSGTPKKETWTKYGQYTLVTEPVIGRLSKFVYPTETLTKTTDASTNVATADVYTFDTTLGEQTELRNLGFVTAGTDGTYTDISGDTRYKFIEYANNTGSTIVKPKRVDLRTTSSSGDTLARTDYFYDSQSHGTISSLGDLTKETKWISGNGSTTADTTYTYDTWGNILTVTNPRNATTTYTYDSTKSKVATETNHLNHQTSYTYTTLMPTQVTDPNGRTTTYQYSSHGWLFRTTVANTGGSQETEQRLEGSGAAWAIWNRTQLVDSTFDDSYQIVDNLARPTRLIRKKTNHDTNTFGDFYLKEAKTYDALGREITKSAPYGTSVAEPWYSALNLTVPSNLVTTTSYDVFDRPTSIVNALGTTSLAYAGAETTVTDANSKQKKNKTDAYSNLIQVKEYNSSNEYVTNYEYDIRNLLTKVIDALSNVRNFTYNNAGWITNSEDLHASADGTFGSNSFTYDLNGNQLVETQPTGTTITRVYDMLDRPTSIDGSTTGSTDYTITYDSCTNGKGKVCSVSGTLPNSTTLSKSYVYGISGVPTSTAITTLGNTYTTSYLYNYGDQVNKITYPNNTIVRYTFGEWALPYNVFTTLPGGSETTFATATYNFAEQPLVTTITNGPTITNTYDDTKLYRKTNVAAVQGGDTLQSYGYTYDNVNNITQVTEPNLTKAYTYDDLYRLTQAVHTPSGGEEGMSGFSSEGTELSLSSASLTNSPDTTFQDTAANSKASKIVNLTPEGVHNRGNLRFEILGIETIEGGVQVFARVWNKGSQIGFGKDGTVDIERFRIINPPILVSDSKGPIVRTWQNSAGVTMERKYREDPKEALLQVLEQVMAVKKEKFGPEKIITGKIGNTTSTFYPNADTESTSVDGFVQYGTAQVVWSTVHDAAGNGSSDVSPGDELATVQSGAQTNKYVKIVRSIFLFDTSSLPDADTISATALSIYGFGKQDALGWASTYNVYTSTPASNTALANSDYAQIGTTTQATAKAYANWVNGYNDFTLNATGIGNVSKTGVSKFGLRGSHDAANSPGTWSANKESWVKGYFADQTGTTYDPMLVVEHASANQAPTAPTSLLTEGQTNPTGISDLTPEFSAIFNDPDSGDIGTHYRIQVSTSSSFTSNIWDSNQTALGTTITAGNRSQDISYAGSTLSTETTYYWRIKFWDDDNAEGSWSSAGTFSIADNTTTYTYAYNAIGNVTTGNGSSYTYSGTGKTNPHAVTSIASNNYVYDDNGNLTTAPNLAITNNWQNQPSLITVGGSTNINMYYDENGERFIYETPSSTEIQVEETYIVRGSTPEVTIKLGKTPIGTINNGTIYSAIADHLDTPVQQVNSSGTAVEKVAYDPFGKVLSQTGALNTKHGYTGHEEDVDTGLVYAEARYYSPTALRFNQQDMSHVYLGSQNFSGLIGVNRSQILLDPQQLNSYSFVRNNPINGTDPTGKIALVDDAIGFGIGAAVGFLTQVGVSLVTTGDLPTRGEIGGAMVTGGVIGWGAINTPATLGASNAVSAAIVTGTIGGFYGNLTKQAIDVNMGEQTGGIDLMEANKSSLVTGLTAGALQRVVPSTKIPGLSSGRNNMNAIGKTIQTKMSNGTISNMSPGTGLKSAIGSQASDLYRTAVGGIVDALKSIKNRNKSK